MFTVLDMPAQVDAETIALLQSVEVATIGHRRDRGFVDTGIVPVLPGKRIAGTAVTLALPGRDSTLLHHAVGLLRPGDFLIIDRLGDNRYACLGGGVAIAAKTAGAVGAVVDGPCTDPSELAEMDFAVWSRGIAPITTQLLGNGGEMNVPVTCGGAPVSPGDAVLADETGVVFIPAGEAAGAAQWAREKEANGERNRARVLAGEKLGDISGASATVLASLAAK